MAGERSYLIYRKLQNGRPTGNWLARAYLGDYREVYASMRTKDRSAAEERAARWFADLLSGQEDGGPATLGGLWRAYQTTDQYRGLAPRTQAAYGRAWDLLLTARGEDARLDRLALPWFQAYRDTLTARYAPTTVTNMLAAGIAPVFNYAVDMGWIGRSPLTRLRYPKHSAGLASDRDGFSDEAMDRLLEKAPSPTYARLWAFYRWTGMRRMEGLMFPREHLHLEEGYLYIAGTKNTRARRTMPIFPQLQPYLTDLPKRGPLFTKSYETAQQALRSAAKALGIAPAYPTMFRRAFITRMRRQREIPEAVWLRWVGHASATTARDHYEVQELAYERRLVEGLTGSL